LKRQIAFAMAGAPDGYAALVSRAGGLPSRLKSRRRLVIVSSQQLSRYKARSPARLTFLKKRACVIVIVEQQEAGKILEAIRIADGLVFRELNLDRLVMIAALAQFGYVAIPSALTGQVMNRGLRRELVLSLNVLEHRVLTMLGRGSPNRAISESLGLDEGRTKYLIRSVFKKLHLQNRTQAAVFARDVIAGLAPFGASDVAPTSKPTTFSQHIAALFS
jgi:DNA-binding NarL/FixJ family response regulator